jgi:hypothetical protein
MVQAGADVLGDPRRLDLVAVEFNEPRLISDAGLLLTATLADRLGLEGLVNDSVWLPYGTAGAGLPGAAAGMGCLPLSALCGRRAVV